MYIISYLSKRNHGLRSIIILHPIWERGEGFSWGLNWQLFGLVVGEEREGEERVQEWKKS